MQTKKSSPFIILIAMQILANILLTGCTNKMFKQENLVSATDTIFINEKIKEQFVFPFLNDPKSGQWSISLYDIDADSLVFGYQPDKALVPASVQKLLTTGAALKLLGEDCTFKTQIYYDGSLDKKSKTLNGNLIIIGNHDPSLGKNFFNDSSSTEFVKTALYLRDRVGIETIKGKIICPQEVEDAFCYPTGWEFDDLSTYYAPLITPLSFAENVVRVRIHNDSTDVFPPYPLKMVRDTASWTSSLFRVLPFSDSVMVISDYKNPIEEMIPVAKPSLLFSIVLDTILRKNKVIVQNNSLPLGERKFLTSMTGWTVGEIVKRANTNSDNFFAEQLFYAAVEKYAKDSLDKNLEMRYPEQRAAFAKRMYRSCFSLNDFNVTDGCGLSRRDFLSANQLVSVLRSMKQDGSFDCYLGSLPSPGRDGTLRRKFLTEQFGDKLFAKTGSMTGVGNVSGYLITASGKRLAFAILNNYFFYTRAEINQKIEEMLTVISLRY